MEQKNTLLFLRTIYLSLAATIGLIFLIIGSSGTLKLVFEKSIFVVDQTAYYSFPSYECAYRPYSDQKAEMSDEEKTLCEKSVLERNILQNANDFNRQISQSLSFLIIGFPVWILHFLILLSDYKKRKEK